MRNLSDEIQDTQYIDVFSVILFDNIYTLPYIHFKSHSPSTYIFAINFFSCKFLKGTSLLPFVMFPKSERREAMSFDIPFEVNIKVTMATETGIYDVSYFPMENSAMSSD